MPYNPSMQRLARERKTFHMKISYSHARWCVIANWTILLIAQFLPADIHVWTEKGLIISGGIVLSLASRCPVTDDLSEVRRKNQLVGFAAAFLLVVVVKTILTLPLSQ